MSAPTADWSCRGTKSGPADGRCLGPLLTLRTVNREVAGPDDAILEMTSPEVICPSLRAPDDTGHLDPVTFVVRGKCACAAVEFGTRGWVQARPAIKQTVCNYQKDLIE
jgi:hypothetical protein